VETEAKRMRANEMLIEHYETVAQVEALERAARHEMEMLEGGQSDIQAKRYGTGINRRTNRGASPVERVALEKQRAAERLERIGQERKVLYSWIDEIEAALDKMTPRQRQIIYMRYKEKKPLRAIARKFGYRLDKMQEKIFPEMLDSFMSFYEFGRTGCADQEKQL